MTTFTEAEIKARAQAIASSRHKVAKAILEEASVNPLDEYDVFLSYSSQEPHEIILGVREVLIGYGLTVYVDKFVDPSLTPDKVTKDTAETLRTRLRQSKSLLYLHSDNSHISKWMPWELGYADGLHGKVGVFPVTEKAKSNYVGQEYLGIYPYVEHAEDSTTKLDRLWISESETKYAAHDKWIKGDSEIKERKRTT
ncbi:toll/interleukin-1 receptor domain-containing protein [Rhizobium sp. 3T7]|uniref:TIR domain-containing protein n=1 Tax=Rhizobium sp. 3T7 TaxID=2874922 RepID=UPI001CC9BE9A|nr:TIR domain-containing protein [Rhizobium sp. 3T7]MBZ9790495.1 toll/interleukin-1 receptor domain-containing protein [Rhizobium sp. 3T7]